MTGQPGGSRAASMPSFGPPSSGRGGAGPGGLRASDAERDQAIAELRERFAEGRLSKDTLMHRVDAVLRASRQAELAEQLADLPPRRQRLSEASRDWLRKLRRAATALADPWMRHPPPTLLLPREAQGRFTIGREVACDMTLADMTVSRWHAGLHRSDNGWLLADLGSTNGTRLNGWRVASPVPIRPGDQVSFGSVTFVVAELP
jgi:Inner membrane component of T3SS, cytoplasmic domain/Domain of unknown function (DUF1707)